MRFKEPVTNWALVTQCAGSDKGSDKEIYSKVKGQKTKLAKEFKNQDLIY